MQKPSNSQRKEPKQGRSKALVDSILEAAVRILPKIGADKITTKKIAEVAGVSIGSLYQYFPNKETLIGTLMDMGMVRMTKEMHDLIDGFDDNSTETLINSCVDYTLHLILDEKATQREIYRHVPELGRVQAIFDFRQKVVDRIAIELEKHHPGYEKSEYTLVSFIGCHSVMGVVLTMVYDENQTYQIEELSRELKVMLNGYFRDRINLKKPTVPPGKASTSPDFT